MAPACSTLRACHISDGEAGTFKTHKHQHLGANCQWRHTDGNSDTLKPTIYKTYKDYMLDPIGTDDTHDDGMSAFGEHSDLEILRKTDLACREEKISHLSSYQLHVRPSARMVGRFKGALEHISALFDGHMGYLVVLVVSPGDLNETTGISALLREFPSKNGPPAVVPFYPSHHFVPPPVSESGHYIHLVAPTADGPVKTRDQAAALNWEQMERFLPKLPPYQFTRRDQKCMVCDQEGNKLLFGPCHKGPIRTTHCPDPVNVRKHSGEVTAYHLGQPEETKSTTVINEAFKIWSSYNPAALLGYAFYNLIADNDKRNCSECKMSWTSRDGIDCGKKYSCCGKSPDSEGCSSSQECTGCNKDIAISQGCLELCASCNANPKTPKSGCDHFQTKAHQIGDVAEN